MRDDRPLTQEDKQFIHDNWHTMSDKEIGKRLGRTKTRVQKFRHVERLLRLDKRWNHDECAIWHNMIRRCYDPQNKSYEDYGARGIKVCEQWRGRDGFWVFLNDMGSRPNKTFQLDRIDNDKDYEPSNCRWADIITQANNKRDTIMLTAFGETKSLQDWGRDTRCKVTTSTVYQRIVKLGWEHEHAISATPYKRQKEMQYYTYDGETKRAYEWALDDRCSVSAHTLCERLRAYGWTFERALLTPPYERRIA